MKKLKVWNLNLLVAREQIGRTSNVLSVQKSSLDKTGLGYVESELSSMVTPTKFVSPVSIPKPKVRVHKEEA